MTAEASGEAPRPRVFGGYVLVKALGSGAMGDVLLARPIDPNRGIPTPVVVKRLHGELAKRKGFVARFRHEAAVAVAVDSPHVAKVYDVGAVGDTLYICMDYVAGWPLSAVLDAILDSGHHASIASVVDLIAGGLAGLDALHTAVDPKTKKPLDIVHRDLSPKNLMVGEDGRMRLIDLGLGKSNVQDWRTRTGVVMGSVGYMPPEQARGERVDARADVYAMGVVAFEMLALRNFIRRGPLPKMMEASASPAFVPPSRYRPDVPPGLDDVLSRALRADKEERHPSAKAFLDDLRSVVPASSARGGMQSLLEELFGSTRRDREEEIRALMMMPVDGDEFESRPTRVFGLRDGVLPPDLQPTEHRTNPSQPAHAARAGSVEVVPVTTVPEGTAATQLAAYGAEPADTRVVVSSVGPESFAQVDRSATMLRERRGVSVGVLVSSVVVATMIGALVAVLILRALDREEAATVTVVEPAPTTATPSPRPRATELQADTPPLIVEEPEKKRERRVRTAKPPPAATVDSVDAKLAALSTRLQSLKTTATDAQRKAIIELQRDITFAQKSSDLERKEAALRDLTARARQVTRR